MVVFGRFYKSDHFFQIICCFLNLLKRNQNIRSWCIYENGQKRPLFLQPKNSDVFGHFSTCIIKTSILSITLSVQLESYVMHLFIDFYSRTYKFSLGRLEKLDVTSALRIRIYSSDIKITSSFSRCTREHCTTNLLFRLAIEKFFTFGYVHFSLLVIE